MDDAGKHAKFENEKFCLTRVQDQVLSGKRLVLETYDKDIASSDFLGKAPAISFVKLVENEEL